MCVCCRCPVWSKWTKTLLGKWFSWTRSTWRWRTALWLSLEVAYGKRSRNASECVFVCYLSRICVVFFSYCSSCLLQDPRYKAQQPTDRQIHLCSREGRKEDCGDRLQLLHLQRHQELVHYQRRAVNSLWCLKLQNFYCCLHEEIICWLTTSPFTGSLQVLITVFSFLVWMNSFYMY